MWRVNSRICAARSSSLALIQGDPGRKDNIMGGDSIGHCENRSSYEHVSNSEWFPTESCLKFTEERQIHETNCSIAFLMLLLA
jgi:hypothetical protein